MSEPTKEYGWRFLQDGEVIREGDEFWWRALGPWKNDPTLSIGREFRSGCHCQYRRRIDPGEGWEIVPAGSRETLDMEWTYDFGKSWVKDVVTCPHATVSGHAYETLQAFRRRKTVQPQWPTPTFGRASGPCLYWAGDQKVWFGMIDGYIRDVYWLPMPPDPTPKPPEKSEAEKAWDREQSRVSENRVTDKESFLAGFNAAKKG